ncbi:putative cAMP phosphodiesterases class-II precursor [Synechococcus phage S-RIM2]|uniref:Putative cAMP phosphodiesterases class-II n=1 Tax=Synechococcus phage S-RIM2 TaxID=687800 RepID=A0A1D7S299_9CAUD|nr:putative cAMP phosphodiesterases class-II precursor [Synechococcus phage S-RIM2]AOO07581.1 putative cAMP phosphodiesterases class-II precursor [Synechococcus phage S-RIM2]AOO07796.1 putative cAMP phosphodiesterases class-II precursor [Synechococcus phage S-RIM2]AOO08012.1 putative cAMP phosphodiesterases class-II precursor [Synechococcus phage S-RIM2]AOO08441.1 putative cAMP phosphodiesterases class-II precursor [Synechococcus phage S-RIM2]
MKLPNWQHHSKKEAKRTLKPQALRQAKKRRAALKAKLLAASVLLVAMPVSAESIGDRSNRQAYQSQRGYASENKCYRNEYREEYIPGTSKSPGYVSSYRERVEVPCNNRVYRRDDAPQNQHQTDDNSCIEGSILGGIAGGGIGAAASRGDGRLWAIPLGIVGGAMVGCQVDGG